MRNIITTLTILIWFNLPLISQAFISRSTSFIQNSAVPESFIVPADLSSNIAFSSMIRSNVVNFETLPSIYGVAELTPLSGLVSFGIDSSASIGLNFSGLGSDKYSEYDLRLGASYQTGNISLGGEISYLNQRVKNYNNSSALALNIGAVIKLDDMITAGVKINNINGATFSDASVEIYREAVFGMSFMADDWIYFSLNSDIFINNSWGLALETGIKPLKSMIVKLAYLTNPKMLSAEFFAKYDDFFGISLSGVYHSELGISPKAGVYFLW